MPSFLAYSFCRLTSSHAKKSIRSNSLVVRWWDRPYARKLCRDYDLAFRWLSSSGEQSFSGSNPSVYNTDVLIVGGGAVGCSIARQLLKRTSDLVVGLVESKSPHPAKKSTQDDDLNIPVIPNPRSYALSPQSLRWLGLYENEEEVLDPRTGNLVPSHSSFSSSRLGYYKSMQVWESGHPASILFSANDISASHLGAVVEDSVVVQHLWDEIRSLKDKNGERRCVLFTDSTIADVTLPQQHQHLAEVKIRKSQDTDSNAGSPITVHTQLVVAADGANSAVRRMVGIPKKTLEYDQHAFTFTVKIAEGSTHGGRAFQRFLPTGPIALLPTFLPDHAIVVWSTAPEIIKEWKKKSPNELAQHVNFLLQQGPELVDPLFATNKAGNKSSFTPPPFPPPSFLYDIQKLFELAHHGPALWAQESSQDANGGRFRAPPPIESIASQLLSFPLSCSQVSSYTASRLALAGDAAHTVHPMAGLGLNLGLQDATNLVEVIERAALAGMDVSLFLKDYETTRQLQVSLTLAGIHGLQQIFGGHQLLQSSPMKLAKSFGMNLIQNVPVLRKQLAQAACHGVTLPPFVQ